MINNIIQHLILTISDITRYSNNVTYTRFYNLIKDIEVKLSVMPSQLLKNLKTQIYSIYNIRNKDIKIDSLKGWLLYFYHSPDIVEHIIKDIVSAHINEMSQSDIFFDIYFEDENSDKSCRILSNRIIKECKRLYNNLDEFDITNLSLTLSTTTCEGMIKILKNLKSIAVVNTDAISFTYFINDILLKC